MLSCFFSFLFLCLKNNSIIVQKLKFYFPSIHSDLTVMAMIVDQMMVITTPKAEEMSTALQERPILTGENPEEEEDPQLAKEYHLWESIGSHVSITGGPSMKILFTHTTPKWNHTITRGGPLHLGQIAPLTASTTHLLAVLHMDPQAQEAIPFMGTLQVIGHRLQDIFAITLGTRGQTPHPPFSGPLGATGEALPTMTSGVMALGEITVPGEGAMSTLVMA